MAKKDFTLFDLMTRFPDEQSCIAYLSDQKWSVGYVCFKCGNKKSKQGKKQYNRRCVDCGYEESPTANTLFHKLKFPLQKAFYICYQLSANKKRDVNLGVEQAVWFNSKNLLVFQKKSSKSDAK